MYSRLLRATRLGPELEHVFMKEVPYTLGKSFDVVTHLSSIVFMD